MTLPSLLSFGLLLLAGRPQEPAAVATRWRFQEDGPKLHWDLRRDRRLPHQDHLEMTGRRVSVVARYGVDEEGNLLWRQTVVWPGLRTLPDDTHASLQRDFSVEQEGALLVNGEPLLAQRPQAFQFDGLLTVESEIQPGLWLRRCIFPSLEQAAIYQDFELSNRSDEIFRIAVKGHQKLEKTPASEGKDGAYEIRFWGPEVSERSLAGGESLHWRSEIRAAKAGALPAAAELEPDAQQKRRQWVKRLCQGSLNFQCPEPALNAAFALAKLRAAESVLETEGGLMHAPGGTRYYAAIWANDSIEYAGPFFPFLGDPAANEATWNALRHFARFQNPDYFFLPSSIIAEGRDVWQGAGDRGDAAMVAYGASRFALTLGEPEAAKELWPLIAWCLEYCRRRLTEEGVVASDRDELEGRLPHGRTNLNTSMLYYRALLDAAHLARSLKQDPAVSQGLEERAAELAEAVERFFGAEIEGFETYRYHEGSEVLRSWICVPLAMGLFERREGTLNALFSPHLWTADGLKSIATDRSFWDRSTLYGLRGAFAAGDTERALEYFRAYSQRRLLGDHVPYPVEAWPEGDQRHLSAESALYARVVTEGMFGFQATAFDTFQLNPRLPQAWSGMSLLDVRAFRSRFDLHVRRVQDRLEVDVDGPDGWHYRQSLEPGATLEVRLPPEIRRFSWVRQPAPVDPPPAHARPLQDREARLASQAWGSLRRGRSVGGRPLRVAGRTYARGIGTHAESEIPLFHDRSPATLTGLVGVDDEAGEPASVEFIIRSGERVLWRSGIRRRGDPAHPFSVSLTGLAVLYLQVVDAGDGNHSDHADWLELRQVPQPDSFQPIENLTLRVTDFGVVPDSGADATAGVHRALQAARQGKNATLVFPPGVYDFFPSQEARHRWFLSNHDPDSPKAVSIPLCGFQGFRLEGEGAVWRFHGRLLPLAISDSQEVEVAGIRIDFPRPHHSQATVLRADGQRLELALSSEYPYEIRDGALWMTGPFPAVPVWSCLEFEKESGRVAYRTGDLPFRGRVQSIGQGRIELLGSGLEPKPGNHLVLRHGGRPHPGILVQRSRDVRFTDVWVHQAEGMGWLVQDSERVAIRGGGVRIPPDSDRVFTTSADATHFSHCRDWIRVEQALFEGMMDDAINVHGTYLKVVALEDGGGLRVSFMHHQSLGFDFARPGDPLRFVRSQTLDAYDQAVVKQVRKLSDREFRLTFEGGRPPDCRPGDVVENLAAYPEVLFSHNQIRNHRARGALFSSSKRIVIENNHFDHSSGSAILISGDAGSWYESGPCSEVWIRRNRFENCLTSLYQFTDAVIAIQPQIPDLEAQQRPYHQSIRIQENDFFTFDLPLLAARSVARLEFSGNRVRRNRAFPAFHPNAKVIHLEACPGAEIQKDWPSD
ncbi:MAG: hypothetical protein DWQ01_13730 [Planctomycetota bacterium]|nr:MAG: hypothetical protein DWQ01_13730 [Planctomycetota bacterium]